MISWLKRKWYAILNQKDWEEKLLQERGFIKTKYWGITKYQRGETSWYSREFAVLICMSELQATEEWIESITDLGVPG